MKLYKTTGLIYKIQNYSDNDKIVWILSDKYGKINTIGKSVRNTQSKRSSHLDIFNVNKFILYKGKTFDTIHETSAIDNFYDLKSYNPYIFFYLAEIIDKLEFEQIESKRVFRIITTILRMANTGNVVKLLGVIELNILKTIGFEPNLSTYIDNDDAIEQNEIYLSYEEPGYVRHSNVGRKINPNTIKCQRVFLQNNIDLILALQIDDSTLKEIREIHSIWIQNILGKKLNSTEFLHI